MQFIFDGYENTAFNNPHNYLDERGARYGVDRAAHTPGDDPNRSDELRFSGQSARGCDGMDASAIAALKSINVEPGFNQAIGSVASPLVIRFADDVLINAVTSPGVYLKQAVTGSKSTLLFGGDNIHLSGVWRGVITVIGGTTEFYDGSFDQLQYAQSGGGVVIGGDFDATSHTLRCTGGDLSCYTDVLTIDMSGGSVHQYKGNVTNLRRTGGDYHYHDGDIDLVQDYGGTFVTYESANYRTIKRLESYNGSTDNLNLLDDILVIEYVSMGGTVNLPLNRIYHNDGGGWFYPYGAGYPVEPGSGPNGVDAWGIAPQMLSGPAQEEDPVQVVSGDWVDLNYMDRLDVLVQVFGVGDGQANVSLYAASDDSGTGAEGLLYFGVVESSVEVGADEHKLWFRTIRGNELPHGKPWLQVRVSAPWPGGGLFNAAATYIKYPF